MYMVENMKSLTLRLTPAVHSALTEAILLCNRAEKEACVAEKVRYEFITQEDYIEELVMVRLAELGLLRQYSKRK
jgi:hypothetical protein